MAALAWARDGADWPHREASRFVTAAGLRWHVQVYGAGPAVLLVHGTAASSHTWRDFGPALAEHYTVIAPDLPGHGFTEMPPWRLQTLGGSAGALGELLAALGASPQLAVGHSAGAAILARMALDGLIEPQLLVSLNGAFLPFEGLAGYLFPTTARLLTFNPLVPLWVAFRSRNRRLFERLVGFTGSRLDAAGIDYYQRLATNPGHVAAALGMMARSHDDLYALEQELPRLAVPLALLTAERDQAVPPAQADRVRLRLPAARHEQLPGLGHLAHEEDPRRVAARVLALAAAPQGRGGVTIR